MKTFNRFWIWFGLPSLLAAAAYLSSHDLARVAAVLMWGTLLAVGFTVTLSAGVVLMMKPSDEKWAENRAIWLKEKRGSVARFISWVSLFITVGLAAFTGFAVTAVFYLIVSLWTRLAVSLIESHFNKSEQ